MFGGVSNFSAAAGIDMRSDRRSEYTDKLRALIAQVLNIDSADLGSNPAVYRTPGWDSLATVEIVLAVEHRFGVRIPDDAISDCYELASLAALVGGIREDHHRETTGQDQ